MKLRDIIIVEMPVATFNTVGDFNRNSSFRKEADRRLLTNPKTVERAQNMFRNTPYDFQFWFVNNAEANRFDQVGKVDMAWMQQNMPKTLTEIQQQGGFGAQSINVIFASNKGLNWRPMTGWMMAHRMAHAVLAPRNGGVNAPINYIERELVGNLANILNAYNIDIDQRNRTQYMGRGPANPVVRYLLMQMGTMKSARNRAVDTGYEFIYECFAQFLIQGAVKFNPLPENLIVGYSYGRPQYRKVYGPVDLENANDYAGYIADELDQEFDRALNGVIGHIVLM